MTQKTPMPNIKEVEKISWTLSRQESWRGHAPIDIFQSVALVPIVYPEKLRRFIEEKGVMGCIIREQAYTEMIKEMVLETGMSPGTTRESDHELAERLDWHEKSFDDVFTDRERACYERIGELAQNQADACRVEEDILTRIAAVNTFSQYVDTSAVGAPARRIRYIAHGVTKKTLGCHKLITACHERFRLQ